MLPAARRMRPYPPLGWGPHSWPPVHARRGASDRVKWSFAAFMAVSVLLVLWVDERFWFNGPPTRTGSISRPV